MVSTYSDSILNPLPASQLIREIGEKVRSTSPAVWTKAHGASRPTHTEDLSHILQQQKAWADLYFRRHDWLS